MATDRKPASSASGGPKALSLHIGLNAVNAAEYGGWDTSPAACEFDANDIGRHRQDQRYKADPLLERVVAAVLQQIVQAQRQRTATPLNGKEIASLQTQTQTPMLIDLADQQRVLWVDDKPQSNHFEAAALAKLQIEVVKALSTNEALRIIAADREGFSLVISDWERDAEPKPTGLLLLKRFPFPRLNRNIRSIP